MSLWMVRIWASLPPTHVQLVFNIRLKGISVNISGSISLLNYLSDTAPKLQVTLLSQIQYLSPHLSEIMMFCFVSPFLLFTLITSRSKAKIIIGFTLFVFLLLKNTILRYILLNDWKHCFTYFVYLSTCLVGGRAFPVVFTPSWPEVEVLPYIEIYIWYNRYKIWIDKGC